MFHVHVELSIGPGSSVVFFSGMLLKKFPPGYLVGPDSLRIHLFIPDVSHSRARAIDSLLRRLVTASTQRKLNVETVWVSLLSVVELTAAMVTST